MPRVHSPGAGNKQVCHAFVILVMVAACIFFVISASPRPSSLNGSAAGLTEHSFLRSLEQFLKKDSISDKQGIVQHSDSYAGRNVGLIEYPLKVFVYDMPRKFTTDLLHLFLDTYKQTSNLTSNGSPVHRLVEQHSVDYWLYADLLSPKNERLVKTVKRVRDPSEADIFYIPIFTTISFFLMERQECKKLYREAVNWVTSQPTWKKSNGRDHVLPVHHPWSFKSVRRYMKNAIWLLPDLDSTGNWYKAGEVSLEKDVVLPYAANVDKCNAECLHNSWKHRHTLLFFRGRTKRNAGGKVRSKLASILEDERDVVIEEGSIGESGRLATQNGMRRSVFCLNPAGDTPSSARLFDAIVSGCIPLVVSDELELPFEGIIDYSKIALFVSSEQAIHKGWLVSYLRNITTHQLSYMRRHLSEYSKHFQYSSPAQPLGPEDLTWRMIAGKLVSIRLHIRRTNRLVRGSRNQCTCNCNYSNSSSSSSSTSTSLNL